MNFFHVFYFIWVNFEPARSINYPKATGFNATFLLLLINRDKDKAKNIELSYYSSRMILHFQEAIEKIDSSQLSIQRSAHAQTLK